MLSYSWMPIAEPRMDLSALANNDIDFFIDFSGGEGSTALSIGPAFSVRIIISPAAQPVLRCAVLCYVQIPQAILNGEFLESRRSIFTWWPRHWKYGCSLSWLLFY